MPNQCEEDRIRIIPAPEHKGSCGAGLRIAVIFLLGGILVAFVFGMVVYATRPSGARITQPRSASSSDLATFFNVSDAIKIQWIPLESVNISQLVGACADQGFPPSMLIANIFFDEMQSDSSLCNVSEPIVNTSMRDKYTLRRFLDVLQPCSRIGIKLVFHSWVAMEPSLVLLSYYAYSKRLLFPIIVSSNVVSSMAGEADKSQRRFIRTVNRIFPRCIISLDDGICNTNSTLATLETVLKEIRRIDQSFTLEVRADHLRHVWQSIHRFFRAYQDKLLLSVIVPPTNWNDNLTYDLLLVRNDFDQRKMYYELPKSLILEFGRATQIASSLPQAFRTKQQDGALITWSNVVDGKKNLLEAINDSMMIVGDVTSDVNGTAWMGKPTDQIHNLSLKKWISVASNSDRGILVWIHRDEAIEPTLLALRDMKVSLKKPVWIGSNVFEGQNSRESIVSRRDLKRKINELLPLATLCLGWTMGSGTGPYTDNMLERMTDYTKDIKGPVVFRMKADLARESWPAIASALQRSRSYKLLLWADDTEAINLQNLIYVYKHCERHRVYYRLPIQMRAQFLSKVNLSR